MKMIQFRIQNYKKIENTGWIKCKEITSFVGKNESGKSAIFRGLSKLNPSDGEEYDGLKEFPRRRYSVDYNKTLPVSSVEFDLEPSDTTALTEICSSLKKATSVVCTKNYANEFTIEFKPESEVPQLIVKTYLNSLQSWKKEVEDATAGEGQGDRLTQIKTALGDVFTSTIKKLDLCFQSGLVDTKIVSSVSDVIKANLNEEWEKILFKKIIDENEKFLDIIKTVDEIDKAEDWVIDNIPQFIYFDRYDILESSIHIDDFIRRINKRPNDPRLRITKCLFKHVGLNVDEISALDPNDEKKTIKELERMADERHIKMNAASSAMTSTFANWWEQRKHKFKYQVDGQLFRVWVSDDLDESDIELDQRSAGMQYFFSFYLVFLVESKEAHVNSILLLDEPGLQYHGTAQQKAVEFLEKVSKENQVLYTTHSPFMINGDRLDDVRIVYEDKNTGNTLVSDDIWPRDKDSLFPLQAGLGYSLAQTLFYSKYQLVVEGLTDYSILKAMNELLSRKKMKNLDSKIVISPAGGTKHIMPLASMMLANKIKIVVLLDADQPGIQKEKHLEKLQVSCIMVNSYAEKKTAEIEDLFSEELYLDAVKESYPGKEIIFSPEEEKIVLITERVEALFKRKDYGELEKWRPANVIVDWIQQDSVSHKISDKTCKTFELLCEKVNELLK